jgi:hypothetical protein
MSTVPSFFHAKYKGTVDAKAKVCDKFAEGSQFSGG